METNIRHKMMYINNLYPTFINRKSATIKKTNWGIILTLNDSSHIDSSF